MTFVVCPLDLVETVAAARSPSHILSLLGPEVAPPACADHPAVARLHLAFNDVVEPVLGLTPPAMEHVEAVIDFGRRWRREAPMLVHCWAGISRSTAAAYIMACDTLGPGCEDEVAWRLRAASPTAFPNRLMIELADTALGRRGFMARAIADIGRGEVSQAGRPFDLTLD
jgi:predicted protein tyrosine phosphatase